MIRVMKQRGRVGQLIFEPIPIGGVKNVAYIVGDAKTRLVAVVDPGRKPDLILEHVSRLGATVKYILATHGHQDHIGAADIGAAATIKQATGAPVAAYKTVPGVDVLLDDGDALQIGTVRIEVIHTPGHSADSVCFLVKQQKLLTGDTLYVGKVSKGPTKAMMRKFFDSLHNRVMKLSDTVEVWPGHDVGTKSSSTIGEERRHNSVLQMSFEEFCDRRYNKKKDKWIVPRRSRCRQ
jgi:hydroxyacylglutathione hydrolase